MEWYTKDVKDLIGEIQCPVIVIFFIITKSSSIMSFKMVNELTVLGIDPDKV
jgi:hypothetical protein